MMSIITGVRNLAYIFLDSDKILCEVEIDDSGKWDQFLAVSDDVELHGAEIHAAILAGDHGIIAPYAPSATTQIAEIEAAIDLALNAKARERGYSGISAIGKYAGSDPALPADDIHFAQAETWRTECNALRVWLNTTWASVYSYLATVQAGTNPMPTSAEAVSMMPEFTWPD